MITVVDPWHWLDEHGELPMEPRMRAKALRVAQCIEAGGPLRRGEVRETLIACRRRPERRPCPGMLWVMKQSDDAIHAFCGACRADEYMIYNWENTLWADGPMEPVDVAAMAAEEGRTPREPEPADLHPRLERALALLRSRMSAREVRRLVERSPDPSGVLQAVLASAAAPPSQDALERLLPLLMELWNTTPRSELGGRTPEEMYTTGVRPPPAPSRAAKVGRNEPCPCGSGRKYKKCCLLTAPN